MIDTNKPAVFLHTTAMPALDHVPIIRPAGPRLRFESTLTNRVRGRNDPRSVQ
jgi:hypothetical protein